MTRSLVAGVAAGAAALASCMLAAPASASLPAAGDPVSAAHSTLGQSLAGKTIVIDPGHQLGNSTHPRQINRPVNAGGFMKPCNTTGTATNGGYPEATFTWKVAKALAHQLRARGARVLMTRHTNSYDDWGPCIDERGRAGNSAHADAKVSIHGDGADSSVRGFFVIRPADRRHWTHDIFRSSSHLAKRVKAGLLRAGARASNSYGGNGLDVRGDLGTLNWSNRPAVLVELGNMRNARDARHMTNPKYRRHAYARGLRLGLTRFVLR
jgi:N-acetylmuramoyl-L-alanine amidase